MSPKNPTQAERLAQIRAALDELRLGDMGVQLDTELDNTDDDTWLERLWRLLDAQRGDRNLKAPCASTAAPVGAPRSARELSYSFVMRP